MICLPARGIINKKDIGISMNIRTKLLITGTSGFLGKRIAQYYRDKYECITPSHKELEIGDPDCCMDIIKAAKPDYIIHTAAISDMRACEDDPESSRQVNVTGVENLAKACLAAGSRLIFMSSDQVYNGNHDAALHRETDSCRPANVYGRQKLEAEQRMLAVLPEAIALRLTWMYDLPTPQLDTKDNFLTNIMKAIENKQRIAFSDQEYRGITYVKEVVQNMEKVFDLPGGSYNFGSYAENTTYMLAKEVVQLLGISGQRDDLLEKTIHAVPRSLAMDQTKLNSHHIYFSENSKGVQDCLQENNTGSAG